MSTAGLQATELECAEGRTAPRVSLADIGANIASITYIAGDDILGCGTTEINSDCGEACYASAAVLTVCLLVTRNGFTIIGKSAPASPENFDAELGRKLAYEDAVRQLWPLMGYELRQRLYNEENGNG